MEQYYKIGMELAKNNKISNAKIIQLQRCIQNNNVNSAVHHILEMYVNGSKSMPVELGDLIIDLLAKNSIDEQENLLCFVMGVYNASLN